MNKNTLKALRGSIAKWKAIAEGTGRNLGSKNCSLCKLFAGAGCVKCPVALKTGEPDCYDTPYYDFWRLDPPDVEGNVWGYGTRAISAKAKRAARREQRFLESLLPEGEQP